MISIYHIFTFAKVSKELYCKKTLTCSIIWTLLSSFITPDNIFALFMFIFTRKKKSSIVWYYIF